MRLKVWRLSKAVKPELPIQFGHEQLNSYGGLEFQNGRAKFARRDSCRESPVIGRTVAFSAATGLQMGTLGVGFLMIRAGYCERRRLAGGANEI
jgi:hypothetical protein